MMRQRLFCLVALVAAGLSAAPVKAAHIWVAPSGSDSNPGTKSAPLASLHSALRKARELRRLSDSSVAGGIHIVLRGGVYSLSEPVFIRPEDAGTATSPTTIEAAPGERPVLSGGVLIGSWQKAAGSIPGLPASARGKVWISNAPVVGGHSLLFRQLWVNGKKAVRARDVDGNDKMSRILSVDKAKQEMWIPAPPVALPKHPAQMELFIHQMWAIANLRIKSIEVIGDKARVTFHQPESRIQFEHPWPEAVIDKEHKQNGNSAFYLSNAIEFLDSPGEWYEDVTNGKVYYWPRTGENMTTARVVAPALEKLVQVTGTLDRPVAYLYLKNIGFEYATWLRPSEAGHVPLQAGMYLLDAYKLKISGVGERKGLENQAWIGRPPGAVEVMNAHHTGFEGCTFRHLASTGLDYIRGTHDDEVRGCLFTDIGGTGIQAGVYDDESHEAHVNYNPTDERDVCTHLHIVNNLVTDVTNEDWGCVGISAGFVRNINIEHNEVSEVSYSGICVGWGWLKAVNVMRNNRIYANSVHHYASHMFDVGGIYTLSAQPGTVISENYVDSIYHPIYVHDPNHWFWFYFDEGSGYITIKDNWCPSDKVMRNANGPGNTWENNGPMVSDKIKLAAGLEPAYQYLRKESQFVRLLKPDRQKIKRSLEHKTTTMLTLGILGLGEGRSTMSAALQSPKWKLKTICDRNEELCRHRADEFNFHNYTTDYNDMLQDDEIDVIAIYTPDHLHAEHVKLALQHGKHVVCTKPFIDDLSKARELLELCDASGRKVFIGQSSRFFEPMKRQRKDYEAGLIGELITIEAYYHADHRWFLEKPWSLQQAFKWLYGGLSHPTDFIRWYLPDIEEVMGYGMLSANGAKGGLVNPDTMHFIFKAKNGRVARVSGAYTGPVQPVTRDSEMSCILRGTEGCSQGDYMDLRYAVTDRSGEERIITWEHKLKHYFRFEGKSHHAGEYQNYLEYFANAIETGDDAYPDIREGIGTIALLQAMDQSLQTGVPVKVDAILAAHNLTRDLLKASGE